VDDNEWLAQRFEEHRTHLRAVAYRMLGSINEADDAVQEAWLRLSRSDPSEVQNLGGWLTTVVSRVSLDMLRSRKSRREDALDDHLDATVAAADEGFDPEEQAVLADSLGPALLVVLDTLGPAERLAFVLHDMFGVPFDEIGAILGRSPDAAKQLASRARRRVQGRSPEPGGDRTRQRQIVDAFLAASRGGDFDGLLALLHPDVVLHADDTIVRWGGDGEVRGPVAVAQTFSGRAKAAGPALVDGVPGAAWAPGGEPKVVFMFSISDGQIVGIEMVADPGRLGELELVLDD
jgi:RNA polymerase sigma-70 factor (ECF subfamily)